MFKNSVGDKRGELLSAQAKKQLIYQDDKFIYYVNSASIGEVLAAEIKHGGVLGAEFFGDLIINHLLIAEISSPNETKQLLEASDMPTLLNAPRQSELGKLFYLSVKELTEQINSAFMPVAEKTNPQEQKKN